MGWMRRTRTYAHCIRGPREQHLWVMDVTLFGRNVEITKNSKAWMGRQLVFEP